MHIPPKLPLVAALALVLTACASAPNGPSQMALPGTGKNFDQFRIDDVDCRQYSTAQLGTSPEQASTNSGVKSAAIGTGVGALAGLAIGGTGRGAATGAGIGLLFGGIAGSGAADRSARTQQDRYDIAYTQCMYAKGHKVPVTAANNYTTQQMPAAAPGAPNPPPPPPGVIGPPAGADQSYSR